MLLKDLLLLGEQKAAAKTEAARLTLHGAHTPDNVFDTEGKASKNQR